MRIEPKKLMVAVRFEVFVSTILVLDTPRLEVFPQPMQPARAAVPLSISPSSPQIQFGLVNEILENSEYTDYCGSRCKRLRPSDTLAVAQYANEELP